MAIMDQPGPLASAAFVLIRQGGPEALAVLRWGVRPPGPYEVRIRVEAAGISGADPLMCQGLHPERYFPKRRRTPLVPGWDVVGVIESVGSRVSHVSVGQRVAALSIVGGWAEHALAPAAWAVRIPAGLAPTTAVCLILDYMTAYQMLTRSTSTGRGDTVLEGDAIPDSGAAQRIAQKILLTCGAKVESERAIHLVLRLVGRVVLELRDQRVEFIPGLREILLAELEGIVGRLHLDPHLVADGRVEKKPASAAIARKMVHGIDYRAGFGLPGRPERR